MKTLFLSIALSSSLFAETFVVETTKKLSKQELQSIASIKGVKSAERFLPFGQGYLERLYEVEASDKNALKVLGSHELVKLIEADHDVDFFEIRSNDKTSMDVDDILYPLQWGLRNQAQVTSAQMPNGGPEEKIGKDGQDIDWFETIDSIERSLKKTPAVAVIDMGIDFDHPELSEQIYKNEAECDNGVPPTGQMQDRDGNGLRGDCYGWNFASTSYLYDAHPFDDTGHGTHVSGIISAKRNNKLGVSGVSDKIKILPVKVTGMVDMQGETNKLKYKATSRRIAKGIFYAVHRGVDVINLSLGWPKTMNTRYLDMAIKNAVRNNVLVVAAAGNNNTNATIFPCAYREVVCVGSIDNDGEISRFSNYGGEVDILAPGDQIASTIPTAFIPLKLNVQGYDLKSGTSQAAPYVSAIAALIKGVYPGMDNNEVQRRIYDSALERTDDLKSTHGLIQLGRAMKLKQAPSVKPVFKQMSEAVFNPNNGKFRQLFLNFKNFGSQSEEVEVELSSLVEGVEIEQKYFKLKPFGPGSINAVPLRGVVTDKLAKNYFRYKVKVKSPNMKEREYIHELTLAQDLYAFEDKEVFPIQFNDKAHSLISFRREFSEEIENKRNQDDRPTRSNLMTIETPRGSAEPGFYLTYRLQGNEWKVFLFQMRNGKLVEAQREITLEDTYEVLTVQQMDFNYDGKIDYLIKSVASNDSQGLYIDYRYLNQDLSPLHPELPVVRMPYYKNTPDETPKTTKYIKTKLSNGKFLATPVYINQGPVPEIDQDQDPWLPKDNSILRRIYWLELDEEKSLYAYRTFMNRDFGDLVRDQFKNSVAPAISVNDTGVELIALKAQSEKDFQNGVVKGVFSFGLGFQRIAVESIFDGAQLSFTHLDYVKSSLVGNAIHPVQDLGQKQGNSFVGFLTSSTLNISHLYEGEERRYVYRLDTPYDSLVSYIASFDKNDRTYVFLETIDDILLLEGKDGYWSESRQDTTKFSFLPGKTMSDIFTPMLIKNSGELNPAIYMDTTLLSGNRIYTMAAYNGELIAPASLAVNLPTICGYEDRYCGLEKKDNHYGTFYCTSMNPFENPDGSSSYMALCKRQQNYEIVKLNISL